MENIHDQTVSGKVETDEATRVAWDVRGHLQHYNACEPQSVQAKTALAAANSAFSSLFLLTHDQLQRSALQRTSGDLDAASDILQETYLRDPERSSKSTGR